MNVPNRVEYDRAMQNPQNNLIPIELKTCILEKRPNGRLVSEAGGNASVYKAKFNNSTIAIRFFCKILYQEDRYSALSNYFKSLNSSYFVDFKFYREGILINGNKVPLITMEWINGLSLRDYIDKNLNNKYKLDSLCDKLIQLFVYLERNGIAHGDLSHTNIMINDQENIVLIDYDALFCSATKNMPTLEVGHAAFQHPNRNKNYDLDIDNFSKWIILLSIKILQTDPSFYDGRDCLIFNQDDYENYNKSDKLNKLELKGKIDKTILNIYNFLLKIIKGNYKSIPKFSEDELNNILNNGNSQVINGINSQHQTYDWKMSIQNSRIKRDNNNNKNSQIMNSNNWKIQQLNLRKKN